MKQKHSTNKTFLILLSICSTFLFSCKQKSDEEAAPVLSSISTGSVVSTYAGTAGNFGSADGSASEASFFFPNGITTDSSGNTFVTDTGSNTIRKITPAGVVTTFAGTAGLSGSTDAIGAAARFNNPL